MTKVLKMALLGQVKLSYGDEPLVDLASAKARALLFFLAVDGRSHSRHALANLFWADLPETDARRNLRGDLRKLRQVVDSYLIVTPQTVAFNFAAPHYLDVAHFRQLLAGAPPPEKLEQAAALYRGEFLEEFYIRQAPEFEAWVMQQRTQLQQQVVEAWLALAGHYQQQRQYEAGIVCIRQALALEPVREDAHRQLMRLLALHGQRGPALAQYEACREVLLQELDVEPAPETAELAEQIRSGSLGPRPMPPNGKYALPPAPSPALARTPTSTDLPPFIAGPPITHPAHFFGRQRELRRLFNLLRHRPLQNAAIIGPRRSGKTSFLHFLRTIITTPPEQLRPDQRHDWLPNFEQYRWVFVDFQDARLGSRHVLLRHLLLQMGLPIPDPCELDTFLDTVSSHLQQPTVILFDEIGVAMTRYAELDDAFWESLRSLATNQVQGNLAFILAAPEPPEQLAQHSGLGSPFFNIFAYAAYLGPLTAEEARLLIASAPIPFAEPDVEWILTQSGRWPMLLQILCRERLLSLEEADAGDGWRADALRQITPFLNQSEV